MATIGDKSEAEADDGKHAVPSKPKDAAAPNDARGAKPQLKEQQPRPQQDERGAPRHDVPVPPAAGSAQFQQRAVVPLPQILPFHHHSASETIFPAKLYDMLSNPEFSHAISWMPHGRSWKVLNREYFMEEISPHYFTQARFESFIRQVNGWGFKRLRREGPDRSSYYHPLFLRGRPDLVNQMRRPAKGEKAVDDEEEPDFFSLPPSPEMPPHPVCVPIIPMKEASAKKAGRPSSGRGRSAFDALPGRRPYPPHIMGAPWGPPPPHYFMPPPLGYPFPPDMLPYGPPPMGYPFPPPFDPNYNPYPLHPCVPHHGRPRGDSTTETPKAKRDRGQSGDGTEHSPKRPHLFADGPPLCVHPMYDSSPKKGDEAYIG